MTKLKILRQAILEQLTDQRERFGNVDLDLLARYDLLTEIIEFGESHENNKSN